MTKHIAFALVGLVLGSLLGYVLLPVSPSLGGPIEVVDKFFNYEINVSGDSNLNGGVIVGSGGTEVTKYVCATGTWNPGSLTSSTAPVTAVTSTDVTVTGAAAANPCIASLTSATTTLASVGCHVSAANTATVKLSNLAGAALDLATGTVRACVVQH